LHGTALAENTISLALTASELLKDISVASMSRPFTHGTKVQSRPSQAMQKVCKYWHRWQRGESITVLSAEGRYITIDASKEACAKFQAQHGDRIQCPLGIATILGVANHHLWYVLDGQLDSPSGAHMWSQRQLKDLRSMPTDFVFISKNQTNDENNFCDQNYNSDDVSFMSQCFSEWTIDMDAHLVHCIDIAIADTFILSYHAADKVIALIENPKLKTCTPLQIKTRIALLLYLNELIIPLLPFLDLSSYEHTRFDESFCGLDLETVDLVELVRLNKNRIFFATKRRLFRRAVLEGNIRAGTSAKNTEKLENALPEFSIECNEESVMTRPLIEDHCNRRWWNDEKALAQSQFGQVCAQLAVHSTRIAGHGDQHCVFKIKLRNATQLKDEVISDGTLYRNFFQTMCSEVSTNLLFTKTSNCSRALNNISADDIYHTINTVFSSPYPQQRLDASRLAAYRAFGQLLGIALRTNVTLPNLKLARLLWSTMACSKPTREHLAQIDSGILQVVEGLENLQGIGVDSNNFEALLGDLDIRFVVPSWDLNTAIPLCPDGQCHRLEFETAKKFAHLLISARIQETAPMISAICAGLSSIIPQRLSALFTETELESQIVQGGRNQ